jgi:hypothetical protein
LRERDRNKRCDGNTGTKQLQGRGSIANRLHTNPSANAAIIYGPDIGFVFRR